MPVHLLGGLLFTLWAQSLLYLVVVSNPFIIFDQFLKLNSLFSWN